MKATELLVHLLHNRRVGRRVVSLLAVPGFCIIKDVSKGSVFYAHVTSKRYLDASFPS